jgi:sec-independent protein translocase protein TatA
MGFSGISIWQLLIILAIVLLLFGTKRLRTLGTDIGNAVKGFRNALSEGEKTDKEAEEPKPPELGEAKRIIEGEAHREQDKPKV